MNVTHGLCTPRRRAFHGQPPCSCRRISDSRPCSTLWGVPAGTADTAGGGGVCACRDTWTLWGCLWGQQTLLENVPVSSLQIEPVQDLTSHSASRTEHKAGHSERAAPQSCPWPWPQPCPWLPWPRRAWLSEADWGHRMFWAPRSHLPSGGVLILRLRTVNLSFSKHVLA